MPERDPQAVAARPAPRPTALAGAPVRPSWAALLRPSRAQYLLGLVLCLAAMASVWQMRAGHADETYSGLRRDELIALLDQVNTSNNDLRDQIEDQEELKRQHQSGAADRRMAQQQAAKRIQDLSILAGTAPAEGPGITITIRDPQVKIAPQLLLDGVEEMRDAGAEVMELNGVRVVVSTWFGGGPGALTVNGSPITAPYVLKVIGDPHALAEGARFRGGLVSRAQAPGVGAEVDIAPADLIVITAVHRTAEPRFARPV